MCDTKCNGLATKPHKCLIFVTCSHCNLNSTTEQQETCFLVCNSECCCIQVLPHKRIHPLSSGIIKGSPFSSFSLLFPNLTQSVNSITHTESNIFPCTICQDTLMVFQMQHNCFNAEKSNFSKVVIVQAWRWSSRYRHFTIFPFHPLFTIHSDGQVQVNCHNYCDVLYIEEWKTGFKMAISTAGTILCAAGCRRITYTYKLVWVVTILYSNIVVIMGLTIDNEKTKCGVVLLYTIRFVYSYLYVIM